MAVQNPETVARESFDLPEDPQFEQLDVRNLGPPKPMAETLETLAESEEGTVIVQLNDREPQFLYPKLDDRGYEYDSIDRDDVVVTAIWTE